MNEVLLNILATLLTGLATYIGITIRNYVKKYIDTKTKKEVASLVVNGIEQLRKTVYKDFTNEELKDKAISGVEEILNSQGIKITKIELELLVESIINGYNKAK